jgi:hypothetical protein
MKVKTYIQRNGKDLVVKLTKSKGRLIYQHVCNQCNVEFISNRQTAKYCSDGCRKKQYDFRKKEMAEVESKKHIKKFLRAARIRRIHS